MIRRFRHDDTETVVALWTAAGLVRPWNDPHRDIERKTALDDGLFLVATDGEEVVGVVMAGYDGHRGWVNYLAVDPERRREGWARALMQHAERALLDRGCPKVNLQVRADNQAAVGFYHRIGYSEDDVVSMGKRRISDPPPHSGGKPQSSANTP